MQKCGKKHREVNKMKLKKKDIKALKRLKKHCISLGNCEECIFYKDYDRCIFTMCFPNNWRIEKLKKLVDK